MRSMIDLCFMCSNDNKCNVVDNKIITQVEYLMPEITIIKMRLPLRFCSICEKNLQLFSTFKKGCVENSLRLETWIKDAQGNTDMTEKCTTSETNINKIHEVYIKEEVLDESDSLQTKDSIGEEIFIKKEKLSGSEFGDVLQDIRTGESPPQTNTHLHEDNTEDKEVKSDQNYDDPDEAVSVNNEFNSDETILRTDSTGRKIYTCLICKKEFEELSYLKIHHMIHLGKKDLQCSECKKWFSTKSSLVIHMKQHTGVKEFQCDECKKWFSRKSHLTIHMKIHTGVKDYQCSECKKWFTQKKSLAIHMTQHTGVKDFQCKECKKLFSQKSNLVRHMKQHAGAKDFQCNECKKWFARKSHLTTHMKQHIGIKEFQCNECKKWFTQKSHLTVHMKLHAGKKDIQCKE